jgi:hypothetical protein
MARDGTVGAQILALFEAKDGEPAKRFTLNELFRALPGSPESSIKSAVKRLRGGDGSEKKLRAVGYMSQATGAGLPEPILELGSEPDVPREEKYVVPNDELIRRRKELRRKQEELSLKRSLEAIDNYL